MPRPVPRSASSGDASDSGRRKTKSGLNGMEWTLRSLRQIDTNAKYFQHSYYGESDDDDSLANGIMEEDQTAYEIFKGKQEEKPGGNNITGNLHHPSSVWAALNAPLRTGVVDGRKVIFELREKVNSLPQIPRHERKRPPVEIINAKLSPFETRVRFWLMHFNVTQLSFLYFAVFVILNVIFAALYYFQPNRCCGDPDMTFEDNFNYAVQTSATIGYGVLAPKGTYSHFLVVCITYWAVLVNTLFAGLLFTKFVTPVINIQFSDVMTLCNVNGVPCLSIRLGAPDGSFLNPMTDVNVRLTYSYQIPYTDHKKDTRYFRQTEELQLLSNRQHGFKEGFWTLRHILDESSPLFGLNFDEHPGNKIYVFTLSVDAVQDLTKSSVNVQTEYALEDILIGHGFVNMVEDNDVVDFSKISITEPYPVWYPAPQGKYMEEISFHNTRSYD